MDHKTDDNSQRTVIRVAIPFNRESRQITNLRVFWFVYSLVALKRNPDVSFFLLDERELCARKDYNAVFSVQGCGMSQRTLKYFEKKQHKSVSVAGRHPSLYLLVSGSVRGVNHLL